MLNRISTILLLGWLKFSVTLAKEIKLNLLSQLVNLRIRLNLYLKAKFVSKI